MIWTRVYRETTAACAQWGTWPAPFGYQGSVP